MRSRKWEEGESLSVHFSKDSNAVTMRKRQRRQQQQPPASSLIYIAIVTIAAAALIPKVYTWTTRTQISRGGDHTFRGGTFCSASRPNESALLHFAAINKSNSSKPILVIGATGKIGRKVVQILLGKNRPVRAVVRDLLKAKQIFGTDTSFQYPNLEIIKANLGHEKYEDVLDKAVKGCSDIISVTGGCRLATLTDFLPWRVFSTMAEWADRDHPYFANYRAHQYLIKLAEKHNIQRFIQLSSLGVTCSPFDPTTILFNTLLSFKHRWAILTELALFESKVPHVILRPGGLEDQERNLDTTNLHVTVSGGFPCPARVGISDVAALAVEATTFPQDAPHHLTLACRWRKRDVGIENDGFETAQECITDICNNHGKLNSPPPVTKPYGVAVAMFVYPLMVLAIKTLSIVWKIVVKICLKRDCW